MTNNIKAYEGMGSLLARLPFNTSIKDISSSAMTGGEEQIALHRILQASISTLIRARQYYQLEDCEVEACSAGFASELMNIVANSRQQQKRPIQMMQVDGENWELVFDPGYERDQLLTDESGRVWRKSKTELPF